MEWITAHWSDILIIGSSTITGASVVVRLTPTKVDDEWLAKFLKLLEVVALNNTPVSKK